MCTAGSPAAFDDLKAAVRRANRNGEVRFYPGSPVLIGAALRSRDRYIACELRPDDHAALRRVLPRHAGVDVLRGDGWTIALDRAPPGPAPLLVLIDPPFERPDDARQAIGLCGRIVKKNRSAVIALWVPIKDLAGFDALVTGLDDAIGAAPMMVIEARLRPLTDPMKMNGCAMLVANPPIGLETSAAAAVDWIARNLGERGGMGRVERARN
jgi:23S rRNA (adenine2030-N6)-methyltransferase